RSRHEQSRGAFVCGERGFGLCVLAPGIRGMGALACAARRLVQSYYRPTFSASGSCTFDAAGLLDMAYAAANGTKKVILVSVSETKRQKNLYKLADGAKDAIQTDGGRSPGGVQALGHQAARRRSSPPGPRDPMGAVSWPGHGYICPGLVIGHAAL